MTEYIRPEQIRVISGDQGNVDRSGQDRIDQGDIDRSGQDIMDNDKY